MYNKIVFLCGARDYHAMDWYRSAKKIINNKEIIILTDLIEGEGFKKLINNNDKVFKLFILDKLLFKKQKGIGNIWRNLLKILVLPIQIFKLKYFFKKNPGSVFLAHGMYYLFLGACSKVPYIGTPQGSEILIRPFRSKLYRYFAVKSLVNAKAVTVDSESMKRKIKELSGVEANIIQNGIDIKDINKITKSHKVEKRDKYVSIRGLTPLYRINEIIIARNSSTKYNELPLTFIYPFYEEEYKKGVFSKIKQYDTDLNRIDRDEMYKLFMESKLVFSIPVSDSSPRSVYEAIFCGAVVAITYNKYYEALPDCMKSRIILINLNDKNWFNKAIDYADKIIEKPFIPSEYAIDLFDQVKSFEKLLKLINDEQ